MKKQKLTLSSFEGWERSHPDTDAHAILLFTHEDQSMDGALKRKLKKWLPQFFKEKTVGSAPSIPKESKARYSLEEIIKSSENKGRWTDEEIGVFLNAVVNYTNKAPVIK